MDQATLLLSLLGVQLQLSDMSDPDDSFDLAEWETSNGLNRQTTEALNREEYTNKVVLMAMEASDIAALNITGGQAWTLEVALRALGNLAFGSTHLPVRPASEPAEGTDGGDRREQ